ncbi:MAG TPA: sulfite exporter TauE/SafE family protein, partial [Roseimicrobium sp.]|nr:sulfite exporter TauE/SafE family protein [Roseimicrobium sp.]
WGKWERKNLIYLLPGVVVGVLIGVQLVGMFSPRQLNFSIGVLAVLFVTFQLVKEWIFAKEGAFDPNHKIGIPCGIGAGITSSIAHGAGPVVAVFLIPQQLPKEVYVGTTVLIFSIINWIKMPFFVGNHLITMETFWMSLKFLPLIPVGVWLGVWLNRRFSEKGFLKVVYAFTFITGIQLIFNFDLGHLFR